MHTIAIAGAGTVGAALIPLLLRSPALRVKAVLVRDLSKPRPGLPPGLSLVDDPRAITEDPEVQTVVELMGGVDAAYQLAKAALLAGKHLVSANKNLLAAHGPELFGLAARGGRAIGFEAAVCAGMPVIRALQQALRADRVDCLEGILNGTTNYILTRMAEEGLDYPAALAEAQRLGFAEPDPHNDVSGIDAACKLGILASLAFGAWVDWRGLAASGISGLQAEDLRQAGLMGYRLKLLARARRHADGSLSAGVEPVLLPLDHPLAAVRNEFNCLMAESRHLGRNLFMGRGAGPDPTAMSLFTDILDIASGHFVPVGPEHPFLQPAARMSTAEPAGLRHYLRLEVPDRPGVLAALAGTLAEHGVSIASLVQPENGDAAQGALVPLILTTHAVSPLRMAALAAALGRAGHALVMLPIVAD